MRVNRGEDLKEDRYARFMETQERISAGRLAKKVGREVEVLVDAVEPDHAVVRSSADAPDIDGLVYVDDPAGLAPGDFAQVIVHGSDAHDLFARPV